jgi:MFS family permease
VTRLVHDSSVRSTSNGLRQQPNFLKLWIGQTISLVGSQMTILALPLVAILALEATPVQVGILGAAQYAPFLVLGLLAGVWVDRLRRRPLLIWADLGRAALLGSIPTAAVVGLLRIEQLYLVAFLAGVLTVFFDVAYQSFLPSLVRREQLVEGNSKLEMSRSFAQIAGPGLGGGLVQLVTAPIALLVDSLSFLASALFVASIHAREREPDRSARQSLRAEIVEGLRLVFGHPLLRANAGCTGTWNLFSHLLEVVFILYATRELGVEPATLGLILAARGPGAFLGALLAGQVARRFGVGPTIILAALVGAMGELTLPLAGSVPLQAVWLLLAGFFISGAAGTIYNVNTVSLRQAITQHHLQGRMNATIRLLIWGTIPIGFLLGGFLAEAIGLRPTLVVGAVAGQLSFLWVLLSPLRVLREPPARLSQDE